MKTGWKKTQDGYKTNGWILEGLTNQDGRRIKGWRLLTQEGEWSEDLEGFSLKDSKEWVKNNRKKPKTLWEQIS